MSNEDEERVKLKTFFLPKLYNRPAFFGSPDRGCAGKPVQWFFPAVGGRSKSGERTTEMAKRLCAECVFRAECLALAKKWPKVHLGVMGGTTLRERKNQRNG